MQGKKILFTGSGTAMVTPFGQDGGVNLETFDRLVDYQLSGGTDALIVCGTTGEPSTMDLGEEAAVIERAVQHVNGRVPVIAGAGSNDTSFAVKSAKQAKQIGADGLLIVTPYYNKTTQEGLIRHFLTVADSTDLPIIMYNVPSRTGLNMLPKTVQKLSAHENIVALKEANANIEQIMDLMALRPEIALYSGNDDHVVPLLAVGGKGVISVASNIIPRQMHELVKRWLGGDTQGALDIQLEINPLVHALFCEVNPIPVKTALNDMGFDCGPLRLPLIEMQEENHARLLEQLRRFHLI